MTVEAASASEAQTLAAGRIREAIEAAGRFVSSPGERSGSDGRPAFDLRPVSAELIGA